MLYIRAIDNSRLVATQYEGAPDKATTKGVWYDLIDPTPEEQAGPLAFLCSDAAKYVNGVTMITDLGYTASGLTGSFPDATPVVNFLLGNY